MLPVIKLQNVSLRLQQALILQNINLAIYPGEVFGIMGPSGHGKTSLLKIITGYYKPTQGSISGLHEKNLVGFASQDNSFYPELTVEENLSYFGKMFNLSGEQIKANTKNVLQVVQLSDVRKKTAKDLSGGMQRRLDIACAMIHSPKVLILDEPTTGLDPILRKEFWSLIQLLNYLGVTIILASHLFDEIEQLCSRVAILKQGTIMLTAPVKDLNHFSPFKEVRLVSFPGKYARLIEYLAGHKIITGYKQEGHQLILHTRDVNSTLYYALFAAKSLGERIIDLEVSQMSLEQLFERVQA